LINHSEIFKRNFGWYKNGFVSFPFVAGERFKRIKPFKERENLCFSPGAIKYVPKEEFRSVYGTECLQTSRLQILENKDKLVDVIACYNSKFAENFKPIKLSKS